jgi:hypothetical protein
MQFVGSQFNVKVCCACLMLGSEERKPLLVRQIRIATFIPGSTRDDAWKWRARHEAGIRQRIKAVNAIFHQVRAGLRSKSGVAMRLGSILHENGDAEVSHETVPLSTVLGGEDG